jgi:hypothetical protein
MKKVVAPFPRGRFACAPRVIFELLPTTIVLARDAESSAIRFFGIFEKIDYALRAQVMAAATREVVIKHHAGRVKLLKKFQHDLTSLSD